MDDGVIVIAARNGFYEDKKMKVFMAIAGVVLMVATNAALAGLKYDVPVRVDTVSRSVSGSMGSTRASSDNTQFLSCYVDAFRGSNLYVICSARDVAGSYGSCYSDDETIVRTVQAMKSDSYLYFNWNEGGDCTRVYSALRSADMPKAP